MIRHSNNRQISKLLLCSIFIALMLFSLGSSVFSAEKAGGWTGVDESVIEKVAKEHGREAMPPLINTDQGDLLLFVFLIAGTVGGFAAGYYWRMLTERKKMNSEDGPGAKHGNIL